MIMNERIKELCRQLEEIGQRPDYKRGGNINDRAEYEHYAQLLVHEVLKEYRIKAKCLDKPLS